MERKPLLSIFADGVRHDSLKYMPFTKTLNAKTMNAKTINAKTEPSL